MGTSTELRGPRLGARLSQQSALGGGAPLRTRAKGILGRSPRGKNLLTKFQASRSCSYEKEKLREGQDQGRKIRKE